MNWATNLIEINDRIVWQFFILKFYSEILINWYSMINRIYMNWTSFENDQIKYYNIWEKAD
jgi:hypothetical protein